MPIVREATVKSVLVVVPKLSDRIINGELLRHLAKTANDEQPGIRTNTTICLGKLARNLAAGSRAKVLSAAFSRALRDPFVHARHAALLALAHTADLFSEDDCATKMLPGVCPSLVDKEKLVRDQANKTLDVYLQRIRKHQQIMPDTVQPPPGQANTSSGASVTAGQTDSAGWAGWAISSFTNKITAASGQMSASANGSAPASEARSQSVPPTPSAFPKPATSSLRPSNLQHSISNTHVAKPTILSPSTVPSSNVSASDIAEEFDTGWGDSAWDEPGNDNAEEADAWGADDADPFAAPASTNKSNTVVEDKGEPDFAAWLSAKESQKKSTLTANRTLPKGLTKATPAITSSKTLAAGRPGVGAKSHSTGHTTTSSASKKPATVAAPRKPAVPAKQEEEDEGWGDAWE